MDEQQMLNVALSVQDEQGPQAMVQVVIPRIPADARYVKQIRIRPRRGPWGRIISISAEGTRAEFMAHRLISFLQELRAEREPGVALFPRDGSRVQIHPMISRFNFQRVEEICVGMRCSQSSLVDKALSEYIAQHA